MKVTYVLPLAAFASAFVLPDQETLKDVTIETQDRLFDFVDNIPSRDDISSALESAFSNAKDGFENAVDSVQGSFDSFLETSENTVGNAHAKIHEASYDATAWLESSSLSELEDHGHDHPHHGRPGHRKPHHGHGKPNQTIYQLISSSKYTTKLAKLISEDDELVEILNGTAANYTLFAPTDKAFEKIPDHAPKPSKEQVRKLLEYHISPEFYPAGRVLKSHTFPTLLKSKSLGSEPLPQRLAVQLGLRGLTLNYYARIVAIDFFATNGVIHGLDSIVLPPPRALKIIDLLPSEFSTLELGLAKTGLLETLNTTDHPGGTLFAPSNFAFQKLGPRINAFLFSSHGLKYLKAVLQYHVAPAKTLYSDAFYDGTSADEFEQDSRGYFHVDMPTMLEDKSLSVDVSNSGFFAGIRINGFTRVTAKDGVAKDGVIQVVSSVLIPPRNSEIMEEDVELSLEEFMERLAPFVDEE